jgi:RNA polymerase sigma factor (sigma-70 family)
MPPAGTVGIVDESGPQVGENSRGIAPRSSYHWPPGSMPAPHVFPIGDPQGLAKTTAELLERVRAGEAGSLDVLLQRCLPPLRRWARGRLPRFARDLGDTQDVVQDVVVHALTRLTVFEHRHQGALQAYLRQAVSNRIRDEVRRHARRPAPVELEDKHADGAPSPLEQAIGSEGVERYEAALARLEARDREAIIARLELQQSYGEIALALGKPSADAARMAVVRALSRLLEELEHER